MELPTSDAPVYQLYTIINDPRNIIFQNPEPLRTVYEVSGDDSNQVIYYTLRSEEDEEEEEEEQESDVNAILTNDGTTQTLSNVKLVTLEDGQMYLSMDDSNISQLQTTKKSSSLLNNLLCNNDDHLSAIQPSFLSNDETVSTDVVQSTAVEQFEENNDENMDFRQIQLEDGTCALINASLWDSLLENTLLTDKTETKKKKFPCSYLGCNKVFTTAHHLTVHIRCHTGMRPYSCTVEGCEKAFSTGYSLKAHLRTHTGEKPYGCSLCSKNFKTSGDLQKHVRTHTGEKPFQCPIEGCDKSFTTSNIRKVHIRSHTGERPYTCPVTDCGKAFASATNYKNHIRIHSGEKPYVCPVEGCGKRFTEYSSLYKHNAVHQPYRNFLCDYCSQYFKFENTLKLHKKTVHGVIIMENGTEFVLREDEDSSSMVLEFSESNDSQSIIPPVLLKSENSIFDIDDNL